MGEPTHLHRRFFFHGRLLTGSLRLLIAFCTLCYPPKPLQGDGYPLNVVSDIPGLVDFSIGLVNSVLNLPTRQTKFFKEF